MKRLVFLLVFMALSFSGIIQAKESTYEVNVGTFLNVRERPEAGSPVVFTLQDGAEVTPLSIENGWAKIEIDGKTGYASMDFLNKIEVQKIRSGSKQDFKSWFKNLISLKACFIIFIVLVILNWLFTIGIDRSELLGARCGLFIAMLGMIFLMYFGQDMKNLVNPDWTGGCLGGYFRAVLNAFILGGSIVQMYNSYVGSTCAAAKKAIGDTDLKFKDLNIDFFLWFIPLTAVVVFLGLVFIPLMIATPVMACIFIWKMYKNYKLLWPHFWTATFITFAGIATMACILLTFYTSILMMLLGIAVGGFAVGVLSSAPQAVGKALDPSSDTTDSSDTTEKTEIDSGRISWDGERINFEDGTSRQITDVRNDGTIRDNHGDIWEDYGNGKWEKR